MILFIIENWSENSACNLVGGNFFFNFGSKFSCGDQIPRNRGRPNKFNIMNMVQLRTCLNTFLSDFSISPVKMTKLAKSSREKANLEIPVCKKCGTNVI